MMKSGAGKPYVPNIVVLDKNGNILSTVRDIRENESYRIHTVQEDLSTINRAGNDYSSNYDHFTYDDHTEQVVQEKVAHRMDAVKRLGDFKTYKDKVTDHIPIMLEIDLK